ncbi:hypothetical protein TNCV_1955841 [Trichonephila clavipes]|nr:hypothetical protein TNCV_1955841 [Trichonephila clavipes]
MEALLFLMTKPSQFRNNIQISAVHNLWPVFQILDGSPAVCHDPDTVLIRVESMVESPTDNSANCSTDHLRYGLSRPNTNLCIVAVHIKSLGLY